jgi:hypothetical protein
MANGCGGIVRQFSVLIDDDHERGRVRGWLLDTLASLGEVRRTGFEDLDGVG